MPRPYTIRAVHEKRIEIRWSDVDSYDHVNNAVYLTYLEEVRDEWFDLTMAEIEAPKDFVIVHIDIDFRRELSHVDDHVIAKCQPVEMGQSTVTTREEIWSGARGFLASESRTVLVAHSAETRRARPLEDAERAAVQAQLPS
jgi:acyl-CoA thioester hydrolase